MHDVALAWQAMRLTICVRKARPVFFGERSLSAEAVEMKALASGEHVVVDFSGVYLGVPIGLEVADGYWDRVVTKVRRATRHIARLGLTLSDRVRACRLFRQPVASCLMQFSGPSSAPTSA